MDDTKRIEMKHELEKLTPKQQKAIELLLSGMTVEQAAESAGVGRGTLHRWLDDPDVVAAITAGRRQLAEAAMSRLQALADTAVAVLADLMHSSRETIRLRAALAVIDANVQWLELQDIVARLEALERSQQ